MRAASSVVQPPLARLPFHGVWVLLYTNVDLQSAYLISCRHVSKFLRRAAATAQNFHGHFPLPTSNSEFSPQHSQLHAKFLPVMVKRKVAALEKIDADLYVLDA